MSEVTHQEISDIKTQLSNLGLKMDAIGLDITKLNVALAKQEGLPNRIASLEVKCDLMKENQDSRAWMGEALKEVETKVEQLTAFKYKMGGILIVGQVLTTILAKYAVDFIFK